MNGTTIYNTGKTADANIFGNVTRRTVTTNSYAQILAQAVDNNPAEMSPAEFKTYFAQRLTEIPFDDTRTGDVELIRISDAAWRKLQSDPDYAEKILSDIAHERATPNQLQGLYSNGEMKVRYIEADAQNCRTISTEDGRLVDPLRLDDWAAAMRETSAELGVELVEMRELTRKAANEAGEAEALTWHGVEEGGLPDRSHPAVKGARIYARLFLDEIRRRNLPVARLFSQHHSPSDP